MARGDTAGDRFQSENIGRPWDFPLPSERGRQRGLALNPDIYEMKTI
jgi:hypothetical protein